MNGSLELDRRFQPFLIAVCVDARERAGVKVERIADLAGVTSESVRRFEKGDVFPRVERGNLESLAAAYTAVDADLDDPRDLFQRSLDWWRLIGRRPLTVYEEEDQPQEASLRTLVSSIRRAGERDRARGEAAPQPISTQKSRAKRG